MLDKHIVLLATSIRAVDFAHLDEQVAEVEQAGPGKIHVDVTENEPHEFSAAGRIELMEIAKGVQLRKAGL